MGRSEVGPVNVTQRLEIFKRMHAQWTQYQITLIEIHIADIELSTCKQ